MVFKNEFLLLFLSSFLAIYSASAQKEIYPSSPEFNLSNFKVFKADYRQMGVPMHIATSISNDSLTYNVSMTMPDMSNNSKIITDVIGFDAKNGCFKYRNFHLLQPVKSYVQVEKKTDTLTMLSLQGNHVDRKEIGTKNKLYFDGTFVYWLLSGLLDSTLKSFKMNTWKYTPKGLTVGLSPVFHIKGTEKIYVSGIEFICSKIVIEPYSGVKINCYISKSAPYLIKQEYVQGTSKPVTIIQLEKVYK